MRLKIKKMIFCPLIDGLPFEVRVCEGCKNLKRKDEDDVICGFKVIMEKCRTCGKEFNNDDLAYKKSKKLGECKICSDEFPGSI